MYDAITCMDYFADGYVQTHVHTYTLTNTHTNKLQSHAGIQAMTQCNLSELIQRISTPIIQ